MNDKLKMWLLFSGAFVAWAIYDDHKIAQRKQEKETKAAACLASRDCQNIDAKFQSLMDKTPLVQSSKTGDIFFKGEICSKGCAEYQAGYYWAENLGISKDAACIGHNASFTKGCSKYVSERETELSNDIYEEDTRETPDYCEVNNCR